MNTAKLLRNVPLPDELQDVNDNGIVVDLGSYLTKIGYSGDDSPKLVSRTAVCKRDASKEYQCWQNALKARQNGVNLTYPLNDGTVHDWEALETMMKSLYSDVLRIDPTDTATPLLLTESVLIDRKQRETMATILFEKIGTPLLYFSLSPVLSLFSSGRGTGVAIEMGYDNCSVTPVFEGFALFHSIGKTTYGGRRTTESVLKILREDGCKFEPVFENDIASYVKEKLCRVNTRGTLPISEETLRLPDGTQIRMEKQRHLVCEPFFESNGKEQIGIQNLLLESARKCDSDVSSTMLSNIVLAGGSSLFSGMLERLTQELTDLMPTEKFRIHAASERKHASWVGGSILASLPTFRDMCVTKMDYDEVGASIVHRNCF